MTRTRTRGRRARTAGWASDARTALWLGRRLRRPLAYELIAERRRLR